MLAGAELGNQLRSTELTTDPQELQRVNTGDCSKRRLDGSHIRDVTANKCNAAILVEKTGSPADRSSNVRSAGIVCENTGETSKSNAIPLWINETNAKGKYSCHMARLAPKKWTIFWRKDEDSVVVISTHSRQVLSVFVPLHQQRYGVLRLPFKRLPGCQMRSRNRSGGLRGACRPIYYAHYGHGFFSPIGRRAADDCKPLRVSLCRKTTGR